MLQLHLPLHSLAFGSSVCVLISSASVQVDPNNLYGPEGWCMAKRPSARCDCNMDGELARVLRSASPQKDLHVCKEADECPFSEAMQAGVA